jgi:DNA-binding transcriptional ArsR family regulator
VVDAHELRQHRFESCRLPCTSYTAATREAFPSCYGQVYRLQIYRLKASHASVTTTYPLPLTTPAEAHPSVLMLRPSCILNLMVQYKEMLDRTFSALSDPTRRHILERLGRGPATVGELAEPFGMSLTGLKMHVLILEQADLVSTEKVGRVRVCRLGAGRLDEATGWIEAHMRRWELRFDRLEGYIEKRRGGRA